MLGEVNKAKISMTTIITITSMGKEDNAKITIIIFKGEKATWPAAPRPIIIIASSSSSSPSPSPSSSSSSPSPSSSSSGEHCDEQHCEHSNQREGRLVGVQISYFPNQMISNRSYADNTKIYNTNISLYQYTNIRYSSASEAPSGATRKRLHSSEPEQVHGCFCCCYCCCRSCCCCC